MTFDFRVAVLEAEQQARQQQESTPPPAPEAEPAFELPALSPGELDEERLRKFKERIEQ